MSTVQEAIDTIIEGLSVNVEVFMDFGPVRKIRVQLQYKDQVISESIEDLPTTGVHDNDRLVY